MESFDSPVIKTRSSIHPASQQSIRPGRAGLHFSANFQPIIQTFSVEDYPPEQPILVYYNGLEVTPDRIVSPDIHYTCEKYDLDFDPAMVQKSGRRSTQVTRFSSITRPSIQLKKRVSQASLTNIIADKNLASFGSTNIQEESEDDEYEPVPSAMCLPWESAKTMFPQNAKLILEETDTISLFELPSKTVTKGTREAEAVEKSNETYEYLTVGKGKNRKKISTEAQTVEKILKTRHTMAPKTERKNSYAFASVWDMFDSYEKEEMGGDSVIEVTSEMLALNKLYEIDECLDEEKPEESQEAAINIDIQKFLNAACVMERVLANNNYKIQQENYKGLLRQEWGPLLCDSFNYILKSLWTFSYYKTENRPVTTICVNQQNTDVIAVGYGKTKYTENWSGIVCIWNIKNPTQPERFYEFEISVSCMAFATREPNLLAIGFQNGDINILNIASYNKVILAKSSRKTSPCYLAMWEIKWFIDNESEHVMAVNVDGRIDVFAQTKTKDYYSYPIIKLMHIDNTDKTMLTDKFCEDIPVFKNVNCQVHCWHPTLPDVYFIGTSGGCIYRCSTNYFSNYINMFVAHQGPVNGIEFSKFSLQIFVTCGADWTVKIWKENIFNPLIVLMTDMNPVLDVSFSPTHSTMIAAVSGTEIYIWNIQKKVDTATLVQNLAPRFSTLTTIQFTANGKNVMVSDSNGKVHMRYLLGLFPPEGNQGRTLDHAIHNNLLIQPDLMKHIEKNGRLQKFL